MDIPEQAKKFHVTTDDFVALGLRRGESNLSTIRLGLTKSAKRMPGNKQTNASGAEYDAVTPAAIAGYRVLDPRNRKSIFERIQLCYPIDRDHHDSIEKKLFETSQVTPNSLFNPPLNDPPVVVSAIESSSPVESNNTVFVDGENFSSREAKSTDLIDEARSIVRIIQRHDNRARAKNRPIARFANQVRHFFTSIVND